MLVYEENVVNLEMFAKLNCKSEIFKWDRNFHGQQRYYNS